MSDLLLECFLATFDSQSRLVWNLSSAVEVTAAFDHNEDKVIVTFVETTLGEWRVGFEVRSAARFTSERAGSSIRIFSGVFQAVEEFLTVRQPERLAFASKEEGLGQLYEVYLRRQDTALRTLGYRSEETTKASPLAEYAIVKTMPGEWLQA